MKLHIKYETDYEISEKELNEFVDSLFTDFSIEYLKDIDREYVYDDVSEWLSNTAGEYGEIEPTIINYEDFDAKNKLVDELFKRIKNEFKKRGITIDE